MDVPKSEKSLIRFARDQIEVCTYSQQDRAQSAAENLAYYEKGAADGESLYNRTGIHIDRTSSYLYAPGEIRYSIGFDATEGEPWLARARAASKYLSREYRRADADVIFSQGVDVGLIKGCTLMKHNWMEAGNFTSGFDPHLVHPEFFGVEREDLGRLEDQQCFVHTTYLSKFQLAQMLVGRADEDEMIKKLATLGGQSDDGLRRSWLHQVIIGGVTPVSTSSASTARGQASLSPSSRTELSPKMIADLLRVDELWVVDNDRDDYTTIQLVEGEILLEGKYRHRNLTGVRGLHPFSKICSDPVPGYFWGRSEVSRVKLLQDLLSGRMEDVRRILKLQIDEPMAFIGFNGLTSQKRRALMSPKGWIQEQSPGAKIERLGPKMPEDIFKEINTFVQMFDEIGGFKPILQGEGEPGVRANAHAQTLMRTASPKLRERALRVERDAEQSAHITFSLMQSKDARVFVSDKKEHFLLRQMPQDCYIEVDSHSSSPAFIDDARELAFALAKVGAAGPAEVVKMIHPPMMDELLASIKEREAAKAAMLQQHPELLTKGKK